MPRVTRQPVKQPPRPFNSSYSLSLRIIECCAIICVLNVIRMNADYFNGRLSGRMTAFLAIRVNRLLQLIMSLMRRRKRKRCVNSQHQP